MKKSLTLCASMLLLSPFVAAKGMSDFSVGVALGQRNVAIGDRTQSPSTGTKTLLGGAKDTTALASAGTVTALSHATPEIVINGSAMFKLGDGNHGLKLSVDIHASSSDTHTVYDGVSETGKLVLDGYGAAVDSDDGGLGTTSVSANFGVVSAEGGKRECTVSHQAAFGGKLMYAFGKESGGVSAGFAFLRSADEYSYVVDEDPTEAAGAGVFSTTIANNFQLPTTLEASAATEGTRWSTGSAASVRTYLPVAGTTETTSASVNWLGIAAEGCSPISENLVASAGAAYYWGTLPKGTTGTTNAVMVTADTDSYLMTGHFGIAFKRSDN